ncbi:MAG: Hsp20/alpha crystallin family protein [Firmicutes bacterium]|nr:Hsp20/alpha crystallin family protein [Bacillota bacterium]
MVTLARINAVPTPRRRVYSPWGFADDFFRPFPEVMHSPLRADLKETEGAYLFDAELPGFTPEEIDVTVQDGVLTVAAEHKENAGDTPAFTARSLRRSFALEGIDEENIAAQCKNGVLRVTLPKAKAQEAAARKIAVNFEG